MHTTVPDLREYPYRMAQDLHLLTKCISTKFPEIIIIILSLQERYFHSNHPLIALQFRNICPEYIIINQSANLLYTCNLSVCPSCYMHTYIHTYILYTHAYIHAYILHTHTHTQVCMYVCMYVCIYCPISERKQQD